jgi:YjbE family integral membrane protein
MSDIVSSEAVAALLQVIMINFVLSGDNAVVIGLATAGLPAHQRKRAIFFGILAATVLRIAFAGVAVQLLQVLGLLLAGGILLLWVCWKMWRELRERLHDDARADDVANDAADGTMGRPRKTLREATLQIVVADVSMSLDNVLAVAGAAREHPFILAFGLLLSVAMMAVAANLLGRLIEKYRWIAYLGLVVILYVALDMIYRGTLEVAPAIGAGLPFFT